MTAPQYDDTGRTYRYTRRPDPRIARTIHASLGEMTSVVNVGAGTGSYEPPATVLAVEPSAVMIGQRAPGSAPAVRALAEQLPVATKSVDAALAVLTVHHWRDLQRGIDETVRVARRRVVIFTWDHTVFRDFWLLRDYLPAAAHTDEKLSVPIDELIALLPARCDVVPVPVPYDCVDGFGGAFWRRPEVYLDPTVRAGMSLLALTRPDALAAGLAQLRDDVTTGAWADTRRDIVGRDELDLGYRLLIADL